MFIHPESLNAISESKESYDTSNIKSPDDIPS